MKLLCILLALLLVTGCLGSSRDYSESSQASDFLAKNPDAGGAVQTVRDYNRLLTTVYRDGAVTAVEPVVEQKELEKLKHLVDGMRAQNLRMDAEIKSLRIEKVERFAPEVVQVTTVEKWSYRRTNIATGAVVKPQTEIEYRMGYTMNRSEGRWRLFKLAPV